MADKFKVLVHYICHRMSDNPARLGAVKLNKILWYSDVLMFKKHGKAITDTKYIKQPFGPVARSLKPVLEILHKDGVVAQQKEAYPGGYHTKYFSTQEPILEHFSAEEIATVDKFIDDICYNHSAKSISNLSHDLAWQMHSIGEEMPLQHTHAMQLGEITSEDLEWAQSDNGH